MSNYEKSYETDGSNESVDNTGDYELFNIKIDENKANKNHDQYIPFWSENPNILFNKNYIFDFFPTEDMTLSEKLNAISRTVLFITIITFFLTKNIRILIIGFMTLIAIFLYEYYYKKKEKTEEGFDYLERYQDPTSQVLQNKGIEKDTDVFQLPNSTNPFSNVLITDYDYNPFKKPAGPSYNENINRDILSEAKKLVNEANPEQPNISDKLFKGLGDELEFEQSLRQFNSNPSTTIPNDQQAFSEFCYGSMVSCKEGNLFACARNLSRYTIGQE
jgi:hypothetical protein